MYRRNEKFIKKIVKIEGNGPLGSHERTITILKFPKTIYENATWTNLARDIYKNNLYFMAEVRFV
jgi:hypothetical protein